MQSLRLKLFHKQGKFNQSAKYTIGINESATVSHVNAIIGILFVSEKSGRIYMKGGPSIWAFHNIFAYPIILTLSACGFHLYATKQVVQVPSTGGGVWKLSIFDKHR